MGLGPLLFQKIKK